MAQPKSNPVAVRLPADLEAQIAAHMTATGRNRNLAIVQLLRQGLDAFEATPKFNLKPGPAPAVLKPHMDKDGLQVGAQKAPPGALLEKKGRHKWRL